jgi:glycosyltransferase involved in cell wall biosynthesis
VFDLSVSPGLTKHQLQIGFLYAHSAHGEGELNRYPKLLLLAYFFPPASPIASVRSWNIAKYLARSGWDVTVVTPHPSVLRFVEHTEEAEAYGKREGIQRILTDHHWRCLAPDHLNCWNQGLGWFVGGWCRKIVRRLDIDNGIGWIKAAEKACSSLTKKDVDIILASGPPFAVFRLARRLSQRLGRPYVLDYRDPWTGNPHATRPTRLATIREETRLLTDCAAATIVSPSWGVSMARRFALGPKLHVITNGYDPEDLASIEPNDFGHFAIVYSGSFYPPKRVITPVMAALKRLKETTIVKGSEWYFHYYGEQTAHVHEEAERFGITERVILHGRVSRPEALSAVRGAGVSVVITSVADEITKENQGIVPGKVFEALGLRTPILLIAPPGNDVETIAETTGLICSFTGNNSEGMASFLVESMQGRVLDPKNLEAYAWTNLIESLAGVLRKAIRKKS